MKYKALLITALFTLCALRAQAKPSVSVLDAKGKFVKRIPFIMLSKNRIGIPASNLNSLRLGVAYDKKKDELNIFIHETDAHIVLRSGSRRIYSMVQGYEPYVYSYPLALKRNGRFYVSVSEMQSGFETFSYKWNQKTRSLLLQPH